MGALERSPPMQGGKITARTATQKMQAPKKLETHRPKKRREKTATCMYTEREHVKKNAVFSRPTHVWLGGMCNDQPPPIPAALFEPQLR